MADFSPKTTETRRYQKDTLEELNKSQSKCLYPAKTIL